MDLLRREKKMHVVHYYIFISSKMLRKAFIAWEGVADEFLTEIMCVGISASACCLNKYLEPRPRGRTESEGSRSYLNRCVLFECVCVCFLIFFFCYVENHEIMQSCILMYHKRLSGMLCPHESLRWCKLPTTIAMPIALLCCPTLATVACNL